MTKERFEKALEIFKEYKNFYDLFKKEFSSVELQKFEEIKESDTKILRLEKELGYNSK